MGTLGTYALSGKIQINMENSDKIKLKNICNISSISLEFKHFYYQKINIVKSTKLFISSREILSALIIVTYINKFILNLRYLRLSYVSLMRIQKMYFIASQIKRVIVIFLKIVKMTKVTKVRSIYKLISFIATYMFG